MLNNHEVVGLDYVVMVSKEHKTVYFPFVAYIFYILGRNLFSNPRIQRCFSFQEESFIAFRSYA